MNKLQDSRQHQLDDNTKKTPEMTRELVKNFVTDDLRKMQSTLWMIISNQDIVDAIAEKFYQKIISVPENAKEEAKKILADQVQMQKND